jgi:heterodisulfide reductase subunit A
MSEETLRSVRVGVIVCDCGGKIANILDTASVCHQAGEIPEVVYTAHEAYPCSKDGQERLRHAITDQKLDRILIAGCAPRLIEKLFRQAVEPVLAPAYLNVADIREQAVYVHGNDPAALTKASGLIETGVARLATITTAPIHKGRVVRAALVIGSGLSALTIALTLADSDIRVILLEGSGMLGGSVPSLQEHTRQLIIEKSEAILRHPMIDTLFNSHLVEISGHPGDYEARIQQGDQILTYSIGAIAVSNNAQTKPLGASHWYDRSRVKTQAEFETELQDAALSGRRLETKNIVVVFCAEETQIEHCSRICCNTGIRQAIRVKQLNPDANVTVFFRELYLGGIGEVYEAELMEARKQGVTFFRYRRDQPPVIGTDTVDVFDTLTGEPVRVAFDRVVLTMPLVPPDDTKTLAALLGLPQDEGGFLAEPRMRLRPGRYADPGIYVLGSVHQPADTAEALFQAYLSGARAVRFLKQESITLDTPIASTDPTLCSGCGNCPQVCPTLAIHMTKRDSVLSLAHVDKMRCIGCGNCVVVCPVKAISLPGWDNIEIPAQISAALQARQNDGSKIVALACEWSAFGAADMAGVRHHPYPADIRILRMNCSARFDPYHILWAFLNGADGVFLGACPPGECHYGVGNLYAAERFEKLKTELKAHGINPRRLHLEYLTVDDGKKFAETITKFEQEIRQITL